jgi:hypothetical protein
VLRWPSLLLIGGTVEKCGQALELVVPESPIEREPVGRVPQWGGAQAAAPLAPCEPALDEPRALEHREMFRHGRERHVERRRDLTRRELARRQPREDAPPGRIGERAEDVVEYRRSRGRWRSRGVHEGIRA